MDAAQKKAMARAYKEKEPVGGVFEIFCKGSQKYLIDSTVDMDGCKNRFDFSQNADTCVLGALQNDWRTYGKDAFAFRILDTLTKKEDQTVQDFKEDLAILKDCLREAYEAARLY